MFGECHLDLPQNNQKRKGVVNRLTFRQKLWLPLILSGLCLLAVTLWDAWQTRSLRLQERQRDLQHVSETAFSVVKEYGQLAREGKLSADEAREQALARLKSMRYGEDGYFTVSLSNGIVVMHPIKPSLDGKNMWNLTDSAGDHIYQESSRVARNGGGFFDYLYPKPGSDAPQPKKSYVTYYEPWDWCLMTGTYIDDIDAAFRASLTKSLSLLLGAGLMMALAAGTITRGLVRQLGGEPAFAAEVAGRIASGDLAMHVPTHPGDHGSMLYAMARMQDELTHTIRHIQSSADSIASAAQQIAAGNVNLSRRTEQQAASLEETASSAEELTAIVKQNADNARQANVLAVNASSVAVKGARWLNGWSRRWAALQRVATVSATSLVQSKGLPFRQTSWR